MNKFAVYEDELYTLGEKLSGPYLITNGKRSRQDKAHKLPEVQNAKPELRHGSQKP